MDPEMLVGYALRMESRLEKTVTVTEAEAEILSVLMMVAAGLGRECRFGCHAEDDISQQAIIYGLEVLATKRYDPSRPLENFLHVHCKNRLKNLKRKEYFRQEAPCRCCDRFFPPEFPCARWQRWAASNRAKRSLMRPLDVTSAGEPRSVSVDPATEVADRELVERVEEALSPDLRADYLRMKAGVGIPKGRRLRVRKAVLAAISPEDEDAQG
jgi:hypothetical protein